MTIDPFLAKGSAALDFSGGWVVDHYQMGTLNIGFTVTMTPNVPEPASAFLMPGGGALLLALKTRKA